MPRAPLLAIGVRAKFPEKLFARFDKLSMNGKNFKDLNHTSVRPELVEGRGGLVRSAGGWTAVRELRRGRESYRGDERILGSSEFVEAVQREIEVRPAQAVTQLGNPTLQQVIPVVLDSSGITHIR